MVNKTWDPSAKTANHGLVTESEHDSRSVDFISFRFCIHVSILACKRDTISI